MDGYNYGYCESYATPVEYLSYKDVISQVVGSYFKENIIREMDESRTDIDSDDKDSLWASYIDYVNTWKSENLYNNKRKKVQRALSFGEWVNI